jgi:hypothetical protein
MQPSPQSRGEGGAHLLNLPLSEEYCDGCWCRNIDGGTGGGDFDKVFGELYVYDARAAGTKEGVVPDAVHINVVTDVGLRVEVAGGLGPSV